MKEDYESLFQKSNIVLKSVEIGIPNDFGLFLLHIPAISMNQDEKREYIYV